MVDIDAVSERSGRDGLGSCGGVRSLSGAGGMDWDHAGAFVVWIKTCFLGDIGLRPHHDPRSAEASLWSSSAAALLESTCKVFYIK